MTQPLKLAGALKAVWLGALGLMLFAGASTAQTKPAQRIVSIGSSLTEIIYALGEEHRLVARDTTSTYPEAAKALPNVGYMRVLSAEGMLSTNPDLVLLMDGSGPQNTLDVIAATSVPVISVPEQYSSEGILSKIEIVGKALGVEDKAAALIEETRSGLERVFVDVEARLRKPRVLFVLTSSADRLTVAGQSTGADSIITMAGGINVMDSFRGYKPISPEALLDASPEVILMMDRPGLDEAASFVLQNKAVALTPAGQNKALIRMDGSYLLGFGPRTAQALSELSAKFDALN